MITYIQSDKTMCSREDDRPHAVVIGAGFGGLAAAIRLGARGYRVTILERLDQAGGRASVFRRNGYTFDAGPTIVTAPFLLEELWSLCGKRLSDHVTLKRMDPFYKIRFDDGEIFTCNDDPDFMRSEVARFNPDDVAGYDRFLTESEANYRVGFEMMGNKSFDRFSDMLRFLPALITHRADRTVYAHVAKHIKDERLRIALSFHPLFVGGNPLKVTSIYSLIAYLERTWGVHYVMGGTGALVAAMVDLIQGQGSILRLNTPVAEILSKNDQVSGVLLESGETVQADIVVNNADSSWSYSKLLNGKKRKRWNEAKLKRLHLSMSLFVWYFGTSRTFDTVEHHTILMGPRYQGLLKDIFDHKILAEDFSLYLHRPTASDPALAPKGCDAFYVLSPVPHLESGVDWEQQSEPYRLKIMQRLEETVMPGLSECITESFVMNPLDFASRLNAPQGAAFGPEPIFTQSGWFRPHNISEEIKGLYLVGAGTHPGAGVPGVITSAQVLDEVVPHGDVLRTANVV